MRPHRLIAALGIAILATALPAAAAEHKPAARRSDPRLAFIEWDNSVLNVIERNGAGRRRIVRGCCLGAFSWSSDGSAIAYDTSPNEIAGQVKSEIRMVSADGRRNARIVALPMISNPRWSPDGKHIAFEQFVPLVCPYGCYGENHIVVVNRDGTAPRIVAAGSAYNPQWSPDSTRLAFQNAEGIYVVPIAGAPLPTRISPPGLVAYGPAWAPSGRELAFLAQPPSFDTDVLADPDLYVATADGAAARKLGVKTWCCASWSPDGMRIAYATSSSNGNASGISVVEVAGGRIRRLTKAAGDWAPQWSPDGKEIAFIRNVNSVSSAVLSVMRADGSRVRTVARGAIGPFAWSRR